MSEHRPIVQAIKLLTLIERNDGGMRVTDMAEQLGANTRAVYRYLEALQKLPVPLYTDKNGKESYWKIDPEYRSLLSIPFTLSELLSILCPGFSSFSGWNDTTRLIAISFR